MELSNISEEEPAAYVDDKLCVCVWWWAGGEMTGTSQNSIFRTFMGQCKEFLFHKECDWKSDYNSLTP